MSNVEIKQKLTRIVQQKRRDLAMESKYARGMVTSWPEFAHYKDNIHDTATYAKVRRAAVLANEIIAIEHALVALSGART